MRLVFFTAFVLPSAQGFAQSDADRAAVVAKVERSVVAIARYRAGETKVDPASREFVPNDFGAGVIITDAAGKRFVLTNYHLVRGGPPVRRLSDQPASTHRLHVYCSNRRSGPASIWAADPHSDLALLAVDKSVFGDLSAIAIPKKFEFRKGQSVLVFGNPYAIAKDGSASVARGMISNIGRTPVPVEINPFDATSKQKERFHHYGTLLQLDARLNLGTSGGAVVSPKGELMGLTTSMAAIEGAEKSVGFAVPFDAAIRRVIGDLLAGYEVEYGFLGLSPRDIPLWKDPRLKSLKQASAAQVVRVYGNSAAAAAGIKTGDIVLSVNGEPVLGRYELMREIASRGPARIPADLVKLSIYRDYPKPGRFEVSVRLGKWPVNDDRGIITARDRRQPVAGVWFDHTTARHRLLDQNPLSFRKGVLVTRVARNSVLFGKLEAGDIVEKANGNPIAGPAEFSQAVPKSGSLVLSVLNKGDFELSLEDGVWSLVKSPQ